MAALRVRRFWRTRPDHPAGPEMSLFRALKQRWHPVVRTESRLVPMRFASPASDRVTISSASFAKKRPVPVNRPRPDRAWSPWFWVKS